MSDLMLIIKITKNMKRGGAKDIKRKDEHFKIILLGDSGVGKTSLIGQILGKGFKSNFKPTIGADVHQMTVDVDDKPV
jgi:GTPase SAR1 family protein